MAEGSVIGRGSIVRGNVRGEGNLEILGRVEGDVNVTGDVTLGEEALVRGNIVASQVSVAGAVQGDLRGNEALLIERGGRVIGDLTSPRIGIAPGALVRGTVRTDGEAPLASPQRRPGIGQPLRPTATASSGRSPVSVVRPEPVKVAPPPPPPPPPELEEVGDDEEEPAPLARREAPPPVIPALGKNAKAKKKKREG